MLPDDVATYFCRSPGEFLFQRWAQPIVPHVFGTAAPDPEPIYQAMENVAALTGHPVLRSSGGADMNCTIWFVREWTDLMTMPGAEALLGSLGVVAKQLSARKSNIQLSTSDDPKTGAIGQMVLTIRMNGAIGTFPPEDTALRIAMLTHLRWSIGKDFPGVMLRDDDGFQISPQALAVARAAYHPSIPDMSTDEATAGQIAALIPA
ncbi:MAG: hypothetical protein ABI459_03630 [Deltaproteobacteria bacterium]